MGENKSRRKNDKGTIVYRAVRECDGFKNGRMIEEAALNRESW